MSRVWGPQARARLARATGPTGARAAVDMILETGTQEPTVTIPARLLVDAQADAIADRDRAAGEAYLLAPAGSGAHAVAQDRIERWNTTHRGYAALIDYQVGHTS